MKKKIQIAMMVLVLALGAAACSSIEPAKYQDDLETMQGPGLVTGESGEYTIEVKKP